MGYQVSLPFVIRKDSSLTRFELRLDYLVNVFGLSQREAERLLKK